MNRILIITFTFGMLLVACTKPPQSNFNENQSVFANVYSTDSILKVRGSGDLTVCLNGQKFNGAADVVWSANGAFHMQVYSPFGGVIASIESDTVQGQLTMQGNTYNVSLDQSMDSIPFLHGYTITFREFIRFITGQPPKVDIMNQKPDTVIAEKRLSKLKWHKDPFEIEAQIKKKEVDVSSVQFKYINFQGLMCFSDFRNKLARSISLKVDDRNYFSITYELLKTE